MGAKFLELLQESVIVQGILTLAVVGVWLYMVVAQQPIPSGLDNLVGLCVGFYFGGKFVQAVGKAAGGA
jgi:hypothetical protein